MQTIAKHVLSRLNRFHCDQRGAMSLVAVFTIILLGILLGMVLNTCKQVDSKVRMQNAADAATFSSGLVMARGMNSLAFTNHLLCDVFALTAFLREGEKKYAQRGATDILAAWKEAGPNIRNYSFANFQNWNGTGEAIVSMVDRQQEMVDQYSAWAEAFSNVVLSELENILDQELIPKFQQALVAAIPQMTQEVAVEIARQHGLQRDGETDRDRRQLGAAIWVADRKNRSTKQYGDPQNRQFMEGPEYAFRSLADRGLPVVNPTPQGNPVPDDTGEDLLSGGQTLQQAYYLRTAREQRRKHSNLYLNHWNDDKLREYQKVGVMSQFRSLWIGFTRGRLDQLLEEHRDKNLPHLIWTPDAVQQIWYEKMQAWVMKGRSGPEPLEDDPGPTISFTWSARDRNELLEQQYMIVGAVYWKPLRHFVPKWFGEQLFHNPISGDRVNCAQGMLMLPVEQLSRHRIWCAKFEGWKSNGEPVCTRSDPPNIQHDWARSTDTKWNLLNQNWQFKLVPASLPELSEILSQPVDEFKPADIRGLSAAEIHLINTH